MFIVADLVSLNEISWVSQISKMCELMIEYPLYLLLNEGSE